MIEKSTNVEVRVALCTGDIEQQRSKHHAATTVAVQKVPLEPVIITICRFVTADGGDVLPTIAATGTYKQE